MASFCILFFLKDLPFLPRLSSIFWTAYVSIRQHTSAYVSIRQHKLLHLNHRNCYVNVSIRQHTSAYVSIRQHTSAYVSIRQHTSAYLSIRQHTSAYVSIPQHTSAYVSIRQHTSAYVSIRQHTSAYVRGSQRTALVRNLTCLGSHALLQRSCWSYVSIRQHTSAYVSIRQHTYNQQRSCWFVEWFSGRTYTYAEVCWRMLTYADVWFCGLMICSNVDVWSVGRWRDGRSVTRKGRQWPVEDTTKKIDKTPNLAKRCLDTLEHLTYADVCWRMLTYADVCCPKNTHWNTKVLRLSSHKTRK